MASETLEEILMEAELKMSAAIDHTRAEFVKIRTGRANPQLITDLPVCSPKEAIEKLGWYARRWNIELFHKIL